MKIRVFKADYGKYAKNEINSPYTEGLKALKLKLTMFENTRTRTQPN